ncbi:MAG TPA: serine hydrolase domain-containing protein [Stellaceae bacterium]|jgi:CubicO group peptidase (beta-lactamase class C family)|nr:serine hydrolase domain-containing protein [Stellaceae bacterium]
MTTAQIDEVLNGAVERHEIPGVVAMAVGEDGVFYEGAFGVRALPDGTAMTMDTVFRIASMTKAITSVAALQLVEQGKLTLDDPVPPIDPALAKPQVFALFDRAGRPILRPARRAITLRHLLTHTAGFTYEIWNPNTLKYNAVSKVPPLSSGRRAALRMPLMFDPGERWEYGINIDWVGRLVEEVSGQPLDAYMRDHIFTPLGMKDTGFRPSDEQRARQATIHQRDGGALVPQPFEELTTPEFWAGGGGLYSTAADYIAFLQMLLHGGAHHGAIVLSRETVKMLGENQIGKLHAGIMRTTTPARSENVNFFPDIPVRWGLATLINEMRGPSGRSMGSLSWAGLFNTYYWLDPVRRIAAVILTQILPFADKVAVKVYGEYERAICETVDGMS